MILVQVFGVLQRGSGHTPLHVSWLPWQGDLPSNAWKGATGDSGSLCNGAMAMSLHVAHFVFETCAGMFA